MKKKFFLSALLLSLFGLATAKPVQADTSVADIQKRGELVVGVKQDVPRISVTRIPRQEPILVSKQTWPRWSLMSSRSRFAMCLLLHKLVDHF